MGVSQQQLQRWRLILGASAQEALNDCAGGGSLSSQQTEMDEALAAIYDDTQESGGAGERSAGLERAAPRLAKWLGDIRSYFQEDVVAVIQQDAIERKGLSQLLFEPEMLKNLQPNVHLVGTLLALSSQIPERAKEAARSIVKSVVDEIRLELEQPIRAAVLGALNRKAHSPLPSATNIDWKWTVGRNLKNYQPALGTIVPEKVFFFDRATKANPWRVILAMDQSGSMAESVIYGAIMGSILASLPVLETRIVAFDTQVVDLTEACGHDPVDILFGVQLGGGTDINAAVAYCEPFATDPAKTILVLLTDLFEGGNQSQLVRRLQEMVSNGVRCLCLLALSDQGKPSYDEELARKLAAIGLPCFACTPRRLPEMLGGILRGVDLATLAARLQT